MVFTQSVVLGKDAVPAPSWIRPGFTTLADTRGAAVVAVPAVIAVPAVPAALAVLTNAAASTPVTAASARLVPFCTIFPQSPGRKPHRLKIAQGNRTSLSRG